MEASCTTPFIVYKCRLDGFPVYEVPPEKYAAERIIKILLDPKIDDRKICKQRPLNVESSSTFVIDLNSLKDPDDVKKDNFGVWHHNGSHNQTFECCISSSGDVQIGYSVFSPPNAQWEQYSLRRLHSKHPTNCRFKRMLCFITGIQKYVVRALHKLFLYNLIPYTKILTMPEIFIYFAASLVKYLSIYCSRLKIA